MNLERKLQQHSVALLDGALATELEARGVKLHPTVWSAAAIDGAPEKIAAVHKSYLEAGADCISSAGYQASIMGFCAAGFSAADAERLCRDAVRIAFEARAAFCAEHGIAPENEPLIAASIGPYGAYLADGSEYRGDYRVSVADLDTFHRQRIELAVDELRARSSAGSEIVAFETIPAIDEALLLARIVSEIGGQDAWISFSCKDEEHTCDGQHIEECAAALEPYTAIVAIGVNCTDPRYIDGLVRRMAKVSSKCVIAYPNSGERWDADQRDWTGQRVFEAPAEAWVRAGASMLGGCCRTTPATIARLAAWRAARD